MLRAVSSGCSLLTLFIATAAVAQSAAKVPATAEPASSSSEVEEVVVTASRREESLQRIPQAVSALDGEALAVSGETRLEDLQTSVPSLNFAATSNTSQFYIRGVGNTFLNAGGDPGVAFYQDDAYVSDQTTTNVSLFDVERVEVLRGPQGALYGRNAVGGAINIISARPGNDYEGQITGVVGDYGRREVEGFLSGPLGGTGTGLRVSFQTKQLDGYRENRVAGGPDTLDDLDSQAFRVQTLTNLPGGGTFRAIYTDYRQSDNGPALSVVGTPGVRYPVELLFGAVPSSDTRSIFANVGSNDVRVSTLNLGYEQLIGDFTLTVTGALRESEQTFVNDCDGTAVDNCRYVRSNEAKDRFVNVYLASPDDGRFRYLIGATYLSYDIDQLNDVTFPFPLAYIAPGVPTNIPFGFRVFAGGDVETTSSAVYADLRFQLTNVFAVTGQARYSQTEKDAREILIIPDFALNAVDVPISLDNDFVPFKLGIEGQINPRVLVYGSFATAFKDGAINLGALQETTVEPEKVDTLEVGFKSSLFERTLQVNAALYSSAYENLQISQLAGTVVALVNVPEAEIRGAELEVVATPLDGLRLSLAVGLVDSELNSFSNGRILPGAVGGPLLDLSGNALPYVAPVTVGLAADYTFEPLRGYEAQLGAEYSYRGRTFFNEFNDDGNSQAPIGLLNATASFGPQDGGLRAFAYLRNITDEDVAQGATIYSGLIGGARAVSFAPPRNFGVGLSYRF